MERTKFTIEDFAINFTDETIIPASRQSVYLDMLNSFIDSGRKTMLITPKQPNKIGGFIGSLRYNAEKYNIPVTIGRYIATQIYITRVNG